MIEQLARQLATQLTPTTVAPTLTRRQGVISVVNAGPPRSVDVTVGGIIIPAVRYLASYRATVADVVWVDFNGADPLVVGSTAPAAVPNVNVLKTTGGEVPSATAYQLQAGSSVTGTDAAGDIVVTYPTAFSVATYWVVACEGDITHTNALVMPRAYTTTTFTMRIYNSTTGAAIVNSGNMRINWLALGY